MHLGIVVVLNLMIGLLTPPVGMSLYMVSNIGRIPLERVMAGAVPFIVSLIIALAIVTFVPGVFDLAARPGHEMTQTKRSPSLSVFFGEIRQLGYVVPDIVRPRWTTGAACSASGRSSMPSACRW